MMNFVIARCPRNPSAINSGVVVRPPWDRPRAGLAGRRYCPDPRPGASLKHAQSTPSSRKMLLVWPGYQRPWPTAPGSVLANGRPTPPHRRGGDGEADTKMPRSSINDRAIDRPAGGGKHAASIRLSSTSSAVHSAVTDRLTTGPAPSGKADARLHSAGLALPVPCGKRNAGRCHASLRRSRWPSFCRSGCVSMYSRRS